MAVESIPAEVILKRELSSSRGGSMAVHLLMSPLPRPAQRHLTKPASHMQCVITADGRTAIELICIEIVSS